MKMKMYMSIWKSIYSVVDIDIWEKLQGILINGQFPGPQIEAVTNDNLIINVYNSLNEPFLISWYSFNLPPTLSFL